MHKCLSFIFRNRLIEVKSGGNTAVRYFYDGLNRLAKKHLTSGTDTIYLYDGWRCIEERELDGEAWEPRRQYVYGGMYIDEPLIFDKDTNTDGNCTDAGGSSRYFYCQQANYNVVAMADSTGARVETVKYDAYGEFEVVLDGEDATGNPLLFQGQRWDSDANLYYFRNRWYHPVLGRFMQRDPAGYVDGMGLYEIVGGRPVVMRDPMGEMGCARTVQAPRMVEITVALYSSDPTIPEDWARNVAGDNRMSFATGADVINALEEWTTTAAEVTDGDCTCIGQLYIFSHAWGRNSVSGASHDGGVYGGGPADSGFYGRIRTQTNPDGTTRRLDHANARSLTDLQQIV